MINNSLPTHQLSFMNKLSKQVIFSLFPHQLPLVSIYIVPCWESIQLPQYNNYIITLQKMGGYFKH